MGRVRGDREQAVVMDIWTRSVEPQLVQRDVLLASVDWMLDKG